jgi:hypothetical protein
MIDILDPWTPRRGSCWPRLLCPVRSLPAAGYSDLPGVFRGMVVVAEHPAAVTSIRN